MTGAADGIGRELGLLYAREGCSILGIDRDAERSQRTKTAIEAAGGQAEFVFADLAREESVEQVIEAARRHAPLELWVHNAGINHVAPFVDSDPAAHERVLRVNLLAPMELTTGLLHAGFLAPTATLVFVSSLSRFVGYPGAAGYAASKDGLASYAQSIAVRLAPERHVLTVFPGPTRTAHAREHSPEGSGEERRMPPSELARRIAQAVRRRQRVLVPGLGNRFFAAAGHLLPRLTEGAMKRAIFDKLASK